jgi:hypothetical protein
VSDVRIGVKIDSARLLWVICGSNMLDSRRWQVLREQFARSLRSPIGGPGALAMSDIANWRGILRAWSFVWENGPHEQPPAGQPLARYVKPGPVRSIVSVAA